MRYSKLTSMLVGLSLLSLVGCQSLNLDRCHPKDPYLRNSLPAYVCDASMTCTLDADRLNIEKVYFNQLLNELDDYYKARQ